MNMASVQTPVQGIELDNLCINTMRFLSVDMVQKAKSGHPGLPLDASPMAYVLWTRFLKHNPENPTWFDRDHFILSAGHGSALLYSLLYLTGYDLSLDDIKAFRQWESKTPGHPERSHTPGVEITTGPLGQGFGNGVGMAIAEANLAARFNKPDHTVIDHYTYALVSDGDLMEGVASEAASLAGHLKLGKLIYLYDDNNISLAGSANLTFTEDRAERFRAYGWHTCWVEDGNNLTQIEHAIKEAQAQKDRPSLILVKTHLGYGSPNKQDTFEAHGSPLGPDEVKLTKENLGWPTEPDFYVPEEALKHFRKSVELGKQSNAEWDQRITAYTQAFADESKMLQQMIDHKLPDNWTSGLPCFEADEKGISTRVAGGKVMNGLAQNLPMLIGGSADLNPSTFTALNNLGDFQSPEASYDDTQGTVGGGWGFAGRNICFGVREHAMGAIANGIAAHGGLMPYTATFMTFSDYMRPAIRLAALMDLQCFFIFTHDSIGLGEDGPTHQPVEHLAALRAIPNLIVIRPADANETAMAWKIAVETTDRPFALIFSRQNLPVLDRNQYGSTEGVSKGAYILKDCDGQPEVILMATGSEVPLIVAAEKMLTEKGVKTRLVSFPSWELFDNQPESYRNTVLPPEATARLAVEAGIKQGWEKYTGDKGGMVSLEHFGASAPADVLYEKFGFTPQNICNRALQLVGQA